MTTLDQEVDVFLEHFGKKGMKWGVRRAQSHSQSGPEKAVNKQLRKIGNKVRGGPRVKKEPRTKEQAAKRKRNIQIALVGGGIVAAAVLAHKSGIRVSSLRKASSTVKGSAKATQTLSKIGQERFKAIPMPPISKPSIPRSGATRSSPSPQALRKSISKLISAANSDLRNRDNELNIPFARRSYLTEWN